MQRNISMSSHQNLSIKSMDIQSVPTKSGQRIAFLFVKISKTLLRKVVLNDNLQLYKVFCRRTIYRLFVYFK